MQMFKSKSAKATGIGGILFLVGGVGAVILGILQDAGTLVPTSVFGISVATILALIGVAIGITNITDGEAVPFMVSTLLLGSASIVIGYLSLFGKFLAPIFTFIGYLILPAGLTVAGSQIVTKGRD